MTGTKKYKNHLPLYIYALALISRKKILFKSVLRQLAEKRPIPACNLMMETEFVSKSLVFIITLNWLESHETFIQCIHTRKALVFNTLFTKIKSVYNSIVRNQKHTNIGQWNGLSKKLGRRTVGVKKKNPLHGPEFLGRK